MIKRLALIVCACLGVWATARFCHHKTKGFRMSKIQNNTSCLPQSSSPLPSEYKELLNQKFRYLGRGLQSFSFVSEDGETVLKIFNNRYQRRLQWLRLFPSKEKEEYNKKKWALSFASYALAYQQLKKETALLFFHPSKSTDCPQVKIIDPIGIEHPIDLNQYGFALQKKVTMAYPYFSKLAQEKDYARAERAFHSLFELLKGKMEQGIDDKDPLIRTNFGFYNDKAVQVDIGPFSLNSSLTDSDKQREELIKISTPLRHFLENEHPELLPSFYKATFQFF